MREALLANAAVPLGCFLSAAAGCVAGCVEFTGNALIDGGVNGGPAWPPWSDVNGGAVFLANGAIARFLRTSFTGNMAGVPPLTESNAGGSGGAIYASSGVSLTIESCEFASNAAQYGGALTLSSSYSAYLSITGPTFTGSRVTDSGFSSSAAIHSSGSSEVRRTDSGAVSAQPILVEPP